MAGLGAYTKGYTLFQDPTTPYNGTEVDRTETTISISWATNHSYCTFLYQVCYYEVDTDPTKATCVTTTDTSYTLNNLGECKAYIIDVVAKSSSGVESLTLQFYSVTLCPDAA
ncbi:uncharacterized protein LOC121877689 [Homarus americanus]|uniref:uncharacterized protein LOC121877689 n=1 Tax=Homarus americanus TaxID=6706 RepID=UPI001C4780E9|nr:uncharacterized protein LOC121877689 [Homarus americanus]